MQFNVEKLNEKLAESLKILAKRYDFEVEKTGIIIEHIKREDNIVKSYFSDDKLIIESKNISGFYKSFSEYLRIKKDYQSKYHFEKLGLMIDNSRNGVTNVEYTKECIERLAFMGHNTLYLYLEDTYLLDEEEYFGYLRGAYTKEELKEIDDYADLFNIELVPCIQTLAHINQFFYWEHIANKYADIDDILCVGNADVNKLIENMIKHFSTTLRSRRIHLGMDEAYNLGRGTYANVNGLKEKPQIMLEHLRTLLKICQKYDLKPIIWDDMFFTNYSKFEENDVNFKIPDGISLMYWDYYNSKKEHYIDRIKQRKNISGDVKFAGGAWRWTGYTPHHSKTIKTLNASMQACFDENIEEVLITSWADDGTESPVFNQFLGALIAAEKSYESDNYQEKTKFYLGLDFNEYMSVEKLDLVENTDNDYTPSKYLFYEDALMSKFVYHSNLIEENLTEIYSNLEKEYGEYKEKYINNELLSTYFSFYEKYANILKYKWNLALNIYKAYSSKNKELIKIEIEKIGKILETLPKFIKIRKKLWYLENKRYGFEVLEQRFGGLMQRLLSIKEDLETYVEKDIIISELEEKRIALDPAFENKGLFLYNRSQRIMSASKMIW